MNERRLDGCYFRVYRDGKFHDLCFSDLTREEQEAVLEDKTAEWLKTLCFHLAGQLRWIGEKMDLEFVE